MKFTCEKATLQDAVNVTSRAVPSKSPIASLEGLLIEAGVNVKVTGYDLRRGIYTTIEADVEEAGSVIINARFFSEMVRRMPEGRVTVEADNNNIHVKCGKSDYQFIGLDIADYPEMPKFNAQNSVEIPQNILKNMINQTLFAVSKEEVRPIYTGTLFEIEKNQLTLVSVDGYRLARRCETLENAKVVDCKFVVPGFSLSDVEKICEDKDDLAVIQIGDKHISFSIGNTVVISRRLEGEFLNHKKSVPENFKYRLIVERRDFINVIDRVSLVLSSQSGSPVKMNCMENEIRCYCSTPLGKAEDLCICEGSGENLEIGFNDKYLMDALKAADTDQIQICMNTASSPCVIQSSDGSNRYSYMILPVRLHAGE